jgi:hypothetical protein
MADQLQWIAEWGSVPLNWTAISTSLLLRDPGGSFYLMLLIAAATAPVAVLRKELGAAVLLSGAAVFAIEHVRFEALFGIVTVIIGGDVLTSAATALREKSKRAQFGTARYGTALTLGTAFFAAALACQRSVDLVSDRSYLGSTDLGSFGEGLSWWFPERTASFVERENIPGNIFNTYNEGGYFTWRLGPKYLDYVDGRAIPFGPKLVERNSELLATPPESAEWQREAERYNISAILVPLGRFNGLHLFPMLRQFCASTTWPPVYLDEVAAVFVRRSAQTEDLIAGRGWSPRSGQCRNRATGRRAARRPDHLQGFCQEISGDQCQTGNKSEMEVDPDGHQRREEPQTGPTGSPVAPQKSKKRGEQHYCEHVGARPRPDRNQRDRQDGQ